jgi:hypothetical protein
MERMIEEGVRFKIPGVPRSYFDFFTVSDDDFIEQRQNGRFQDIDFVESDFKSYYIRLYIQGKAYQRDYPVYLGGALKQKLVDKINSGMVYNTTKDVLITEFVDPVHKKFPDLERKEVKRLLMYGFRKFYSASLIGCAVSIKTSKHIKCLAFIGEIKIKQRKRVSDYIVKRDRKLRFIHKLKKAPFDGYYYVGLYGKKIQE